MKTYLEAVLFWKMSGTKSDAWKVCGRSSGTKLGERGNDFFPACQVRVVRFYAPPSPSPSSPPSPPSPSPRGTSSASPRSQWALPGPICQPSIAVGLAGRHLPALDRSGPRRASTGKSLSAVGLAGLQPARV